MSSSSAGMTLPPGLPPVGGVPTLGGGFSPVPALSLEQATLQCYTVADLFQPASDPDKSEDMAIMNLAQELYLQEMYAAAAAEASLLPAHMQPSAHVVPDVDQTQPIVNLEEALASVPSTVIEDLHSIARPSSPVKRKPKRSVKPHKRRRAPKVAVPESQKDEKYWAYRKKNNEAARLNRLRKKKEREAQAQRLPALDAEKEQLEDEVALLNEELKSLRQALKSRLEREGLSHLCD